MLPCSAHVRQHLRQRFGDHSAALFGHGPLSHANAASAGIHPVSSDPEPAATAARRVLPARVDLHKRHRHEFRSQRVPRMPASGYLSALESEPVTELQCVRWGQSGLSEVHKAALSTSEIDRSFSFLSGHSL